MIKPEYLERLKLFMLVTIINDLARSDHDDQFTKVLEWSREIMDCDSLTRCWDVLSDSRYGLGGDTEAMLEHMLAVAGVK